MYIYMYIFIFIYTDSGREPRSSGGNTSSNPQVSAPVPRPVVTHGSDNLCRIGKKINPELYMLKSGYDKVCYILAVLLQCHSSMTLKA